MLNSDIGNPPELNIVHKIFHENYCTSRFSYETGSKKITLIWAIWFREEKMNRDNSLYIMAPGILLSAYFIYLLNKYIGITVILNV